MATMAKASDGVKAPGEVVLEAHGLTKVFGAGAGEVRAVDGVDLAVKRGEILLIMGPSGSGKTTLLTMLGGLMRPTSGTIRIGDAEITSMSERQLTAVRRKQVGFIFQSFNLLESLRAQENVEVVLNLCGRRGAEARTRAATLLTGLGLEERLNYSPRDLSGGEKQRVSIARALANDPLIVMADEPTANLDSRHGHEVVVLLREIARTQRRSVVIVSHDHRIREVADRVLWLEDGRIRDIGKLERDPVCGMLVEPDGAVSLEHAGSRYFFCSEACQRDFDRAPTVPA
jgi:putative ABC transport system ATP-binding protein